MISRKLLNSNFHLQRFILLRKLFDLFGCISMRKTIICSVFCLTIRHGMSVSVDSYRFHSHFQVWNYFSWFDLFYLRWFILPRLCYFCKFDIFQLIWFISTHLIYFTSFWFISPYLIYSTSFDLFHLSWFISGHLIYFTSFDLCHLTWLISP